MLTHGLAKIVDWEKAVLDAEVIREREPAVDLENGLERWLAGAQKSQHAMAVGDVQVIHRDNVAVLLGRCIRHDSLRLTYKDVRQRRLRLFVAKGGVVGPLD